MARHSELRLVPPLSEDERSPALRVIKKESRLNSKELDEYKEPSEREKEVSKTKNRILGCLQRKDVDGLVSNLVKLDKLFVGRDETMLSNSSDVLRSQVIGFFDSIKFQQTLKNYHLELKIQMCEGQMELLLGENKNAGSKLPAQIMLMQEGNTEIYMGSKTLETED
ncbi:MAG: hypothetical protein WCW16_04825 [Candidatus Magasanikbacteria bacterium]